MVRVGCRPAVAVTLTVAVTVRAGWSGQA